MHDIAIAFDIYVPQQHKHQRHRMTNIGTGIPLSAVLIFLFHGCWFSLRPENSLLLRKLGFSWALFEIPKKIACIQNYFFLSIYANLFKYCI